jgi:hypothetical protein
MDATVPHGIFEIAVILMVAALGLQMGRSLYLGVQGRNNAGGMTCMWYGTRFLLVVVPLRAAVALMKSFGTLVIAAYGCMAAERLQYMVPRGLVRTGAQDRVQLSVRRKLRGRVYHRRRLGDQLEPAFSGESGLP